MSGSKSGSKDNLNESNMPLLSDDGAEKTGETPERERERRNLLKGKDENSEKEESAKEEKKKKEKKVKVPKEKGPSCIDTLSTSLDLAARDKRGINTEIDIDFDDVLAEPSAAHGFDPIWRLSFVLFGQTKLWIYRIISAIVAVPLTILWAIIFSILSVLYVWVIRPIIRIIELFLAVFKRVLISVLGATLEPLCHAAGAVFGRVRVNNTTVQEA